MGKKLDFKDVVFKDILEEFRCLALGWDWQNEDGDYWYPEYSRRDKPVYKVVDRIFVSGGEDEYVYMTYILEYKGHFFSILKNVNSYEQGGFEEDTLKQVFPKEVTKTIYQ